MAHSNSMWGCKKFCWHQRVWKRVLSSFLTWRLFHRGVLASHLFCCSPILAVIFSFVLVCVFTPPPFIFSLMPAFPFFPELSICVHLASRGFVICRSASVLLHPLPIIISHLIYFSSLPTTAFSICHPAPPSTRFPVCICMIFKKSEIVEPQ